MPKMTGGEALAKSLHREGVRVIFGLPGVQLYHLLDGLAKEPGIRFINTRHEQETRNEPLEHIANIHHEIINESPGNQRMK